MFFVILRDKMNHIRGKTPEFIVLAQNHKFCKSCYGCKKYSLSNKCLKVNAEKNEKGQ